MCSHLQAQYPPLVFNTVENVQYAEVPKRFLRKIRHLLKAHNKLINKQKLMQEVDVKDQKLTPCCGEKCECDLLNEDFEVVQRRGNIFF